MAKNSATSAFSIAIGLSCIRERDSAQHDRAWFDVAKKVERRLRTWIQKHRPPFDQVFFVGRHVPGAQGPAYLTLVPRTRRGIGVLEITFSFGPRILGRMPLATAQRDLERALLRLFAEVAVRYHMDPSPVQRALRSLRGAPRRTAFQAVLDGRFAQPYDEPSTSFEASLTIPLKSRRTPHGFTLDEVLSLDEKFERLFANAASADFETQEVGMGTAEFIWTGEHQGRLARAVQRGLARIALPTGSILRIRRDDSRSVGRAVPIRQSK